jgi:hypothetical protein
MFHRQIGICALNLSVPNDPNYWRKRAEEAWSIAEEMTDAHTKPIMVASRKATRRLPTGSQNTLFSLDRVTTRRLPPPWSVEDIDAAFVVKDGSGQKLGHFYYEEKPGQLTKDEARRIAANVAKHRPSEMLRPYTP